MFLFCFGFLVAKHVGSYYGNNPGTNDSDIPDWDSFPGGSVVKNLPANVGDAGDVGSVPGLGRSPGGGNDNPL